MPSVLVFQFEFEFYALGWLFAVGSAVTESFILLDLSFLFLGLAGLRRVMMVLLRPQQHWSLCSVLAGAGVATYYLEAFLTLIQYRPSSVVEGLMLGENFPSDALLATIYLSLFAWVLILLSAVERPFWRDALAPLQSGAGGREQVAESALTFYLVAVSVAQVVLMYAGQWSFQGIAAKDAQVPQFAAFVDNLAGAMPVLCGWRLGQRHRRSRRIVLISLVLACQVVWMGAEGRRIFAIGLVTFVLGYLWAGGHINWRRLGRAALPALPLLYFVAKMFLAMRLASYELAHRADLETMLRDAWDITTHRSAELTDLMAENYSNRLFIIQYLVTVVSELTAQNAQHGLFLFIALLTNVPRVLFPAKSVLLFQNDWGADGKGIMNQVLGLPPLDANWSPFVEAFGDFMWFGVILYPLIFLVLGICCSRLVRGLRLRPYVVAGLGMCLTYFLQLETTLGALLGLIRPLVFLFVFAKLADYVTVALVPSLDRARDESPSTDAS